MSKKIVYLGLDVHARRCVLACMDAEGNPVGHWQFATCERELLERVRAIGADEKRLALEEGPLAGWVAALLRPHVKEVFICDPRHNAVINRNARKNDTADGHWLCRLLRLGELRRVYHPSEDHRAVFKAAALGYLQARDAVTGLKVRVKAKLRGWGVTGVEGTAPYSTAGRKRYLAAIGEPAIREQIDILYGQLDAATEAQRRSLRHLVGLGRRYPEIAEFRKIAGIGPVGAHIFDAFIQTPERFPTRQTLWRYCRLGIREQSSDGKPLGRRRLDRNGHGELKALSYRAWLCAHRTRRPNEVTAFFQASLARTSNPVHARLNTQRKLLLAMWVLWKKKESYRPEKFFASAN